jgi:hypothetical protein
MRLKWLVLVERHDASNSLASARRQIDTEEKTVVARFSLKPYAILRDDLNILVDTWELKLSQISERFLVHNLVSWGRLEILLIESFLQGIEPLPQVMIEVSQLVGLPAQLVELGFMLLKFGCQLDYVILLTLEMV